MSEFRHLLQPLDLYSLPLDGVQLVEASAGTGKTWTIAGLYVRLLLETDTTLERILVVTFTKAATAELADRLRKRLVEVERALQQGQSDDPFCQWALGRFEGEARAGAIAKLGESLRRFDEAAIFTIHGFCQRVLNEAQLPALLGEPDIVPDEREWLPGLVQEAWIRHCREPLMAALLRQGSITPEVIQRDVDVLLLKPYLHLDANSDAPDTQALQKSLDALRQQWRQHRDAIREDALEADGLSRAEKSYKYLDDWLQELEDWLLADGLLTRSLGRLTPAEFEKHAKKKGRLPVHPFWEALQAWFLEADRQVMAFRCAVIADARAALVKHKAAEGRLSYQDLLVLLADAVEDAAIAAAIRQQYRVALIDEFQDTDPLQFRIFDTLFAKGGQPLYLVGDPKQAIYSFRGADIFTYLRARQTAHGRFTLGTNRRSVPALVQAVNDIFTRHANPFLLSDLRFPPVDAVPPEKNLFPEAPPFQCWLLPEADGKALTKEAAHGLSVAATVAEIVRLLRGAAAGEVSINERPLRPGDVAVLVPRHRDGRAIVDALQGAGVPAVIRSQDSVFSTLEATDMLAVLDAVAEPGREGQVKAALLSALLGGSVERLFAAQEDEARWSALIESLLGLRELWFGHGFMPMWEALLAEFGVVERVLAGAQGERRLTNLRHLSTLLQQQADLDPVPERQLAWFREQVQGGETTETTQLRLESDAERVQVLTIHVSKGLEYPVVFCPFLWEGKLSRGEDTHRAEYRAGDKSLLDFGSPTFAHATTRLKTERLAERLRVLYVALTRACYRCHGIWGWVKESETAPFSWLLLGGNTEGDPDADVLARDLGRCKYEDYRAALVNLAAASPEAVAWRMLEEEPAIAMPALPAFTDAPHVPAFTRSLPRRWRVSSFTGLSEGAHDQSRHGESPDHDALSVADSLTQPVVQAMDAETAIDAPVEPQGIHAFPRGAAAGVFWHSVLEAAVENPAADPTEVILSSLQRQGLAVEWQPLVENTLRQLLALPLDDGDGSATLATLEAARVEMEFLYPVARLSPGQFAGLPDVEPVYQAALAALDFPTLQGYLKGFIDLVYRHGGRYFVLDYKTNWLGPDDAAYTPGHMQAAMAASHYYLQYWLYVLALHRHLRAVKPDYDYDRDMGGVRYLFLRGHAAPSRGVYASRPSRAFVEALDALMQGTPSGGRS